MSTTQQAPTILHTLPRKQDTLKHQTKKRISTNANVTSKQKVLQAITIKTQRSWGPDLVLLMSKIWQISMTSKEKKHYTYTCPPPHTDRKPKVSFQILFPAASLLRLPFNMLLKVGVPH